MAGTFSLTNKGKVALLQFSNLRMPPVWLQAIRQELEKVASSPENYSALVITSTDSKIFHNGLDLDYVVKNGTDAGVRSIREMSWLCADLLKFPMPVIAAMNGHAFAGGALMALSCDWRVMRQDRGFFCLNEVDVPLPLPLAISQLVRDKCEQTVWVDLTLRGKRFAAQEALERGLVDEIVDNNELIDKAVELAESIGEKDRYAFQKIKEEQYRRSITALEENRITTELEAFPRIIEKYRKLAENQ